MYKYQCSRNECSSNWLLKEGNLNGFVLTCPVCGKGRGLFVAQTKTEGEKLKENCEEIIISVNSSSSKTVEDMEMCVEEFRSKHSLVIISKDIEVIGNEIVCSIKYKIEN